MLRWKTLAVTAVAAVGFGTLALAQDAAAPPITDLPRNETLIINNPENPAASPDNFNIWVAGDGAGWSTGLHQLVMDTLWFIDPDAGLDGSTYYELATEPGRVQRRLHGNDRQAAQGHPVERRRRVHLPPTSSTRSKRRWTTPGMVWSAPFRQRSRASTRPDDYTVHFKLKAPNARFHALFIGALERGLDHAQAHLREAGRHQGLQVQPAGRPWALHPALVRPERRLVHLGTPSGLGQDRRWPSGASPRRST